MATARSQSIRITGSTRLREDEKRRMIAEAERFADQDRARREEAEKLNAADATCYQAEKTLADFGDRLAAELRARLESSMRDVREALAKRDVARAVERADALKVLLQEAGAALYAGAASPGPQPQPDVGASTGEARPTGSGPRGRVVDAEYREQPRG
jgi:molecular chaperone DnaK